MSCFVVGMLSTASCGDKPDVYDIRIPNLKASPDESVTSLELEINAGTVQSVANIPIGWQISVDDDSNWVSRIKGRSTIGAATLSPDELKRISFIVRRNEGPNFTFNVSGVVSLSKTFENRKLAISMGDFELTPSQ